MFIAGQTLSIKEGVTGREGLFYGRRRIETSGNVLLSGQFFSREYIGVARKAYLDYPSVLYVTGEAAEQGGGILIEDGAVVIAFEEDGKTRIKHYPVSTWPLVFFTKEKSPNRTRHRKVDSGSLSFAQLAVGEKVKAWVRQFDTKWGRNRWKWSAEIKDQITVETESFGPLQVFVIEQKAHSPEWGYAMTIVNHYTPKLNMITYWQERDSNERVEECRLVSRK